MRTRPSPQKGNQERDEIARLQHHADLEERHKMLLSAAARRRGADDDSLSELEVLQRFNQLENSITTWVHTYFGDIPSDYRPSPSLATLIPNYETLLNQRKTQFLVIRAVVAHVLTEGLGTGEFLGEAYARLSGVFGEKCGFG
jgi:hypothetical protein